MTDFLVGFVIGSVSTFTASYWYFLRHLKKAWGMT